MRRRKILRLKKEITAYIIAGIATTAVNWTVFYLCAFFLPSPTLRNIIAWAVSVVFAYIANSRLVFQARPKNFKSELGYFSGFVTARILSGAVESVGIWLFVETFMLNEALIKLLLSVFVIVVNYLASKLYIFKKDGF